MNVTIVGGGNIGMVLLGKISRLKGYDVTLYASNVLDFKVPIDIVDDEKEIMIKSGKYKPTNNIKNAIENADIIFCTYPAFLRKKFINEIEDIIKPNTYLGFIPGYGGAEFFCENIIKNGVTIFALQKVPYVARTKERGKIAGCMSTKHTLLEAAIPNSKSIEVAKLLEDMLEIKVEVLPNYMNAVLLPGNPLLHTSGSYVYLKNYKKGDTFKQQVYYYQSWNDECSKIICQFSDEMMRICENLPIDLSGVQSIQEYYESPTPEDLTQKFHSIPSFYPLTLPMIKVENGFMPDFESRFYTEDIPYGVAILKGLALLVNENTPIIDMILKWYEDMTGRQYFEGDKFGRLIKETAIPQLFGIDTVEKLKKFYLR